MVRLHRCRRTKRRNGLRAKTEWIGPSRFFWIYRYCGWRTIGRVRAWLLTRRPNSPSPRVRRSCWRMCSSGELTTNVPSNGRALLDPYKSPNARHRRAAGCVHISRIAVRKTKFAAWSYLIFSHSRVTSTGPSTSFWTEEDASGSRVSSRGQDRGREETGARLRFRLLPRRPRAAPE